MFPSSTEPSSDANPEREVRRGIRSIRLAIGFQAVLYLALAAFAGYLLGLGGVSGFVALPVAIMAVNAALIIGLVMCAVLLSNQQRKSGSAPVGLILWGFLMQAVLRPVQKPEIRTAFGLRPIKPRRQKK